MNANIMKSQFFFTKFENPHFFYTFSVNSKLYMNAIIIKTKVYLNIKYDLIGHRMFEMFSNQNMMPLL